jgi:hypothetical protein
MTTNVFSEDKDKNFDVKDNTQCYYIFCDQCAWNGFPCEKIAIENFRIRPEDEEGFIYEFDTFDYDPKEKKRIPHKHKFNQEHINSQVNAILKRQESMQQE